MSATLVIPPSFGQSVMRLRTAAKLSQRHVATKAGIDQSRLSRIEKGGAASEQECLAVLEALKEQGSNDAARYATFLRTDWRHLERPDFWNPDGGTIRLAEETLSVAAEFSDSADAPWPLRRQLERQTDLLAAAARYLGDIAQNIAFVGEIGVGKSTALSFLYDLLLPVKESAKLTDRVLLEAGGGGTTVCEVCIRRGPIFGIVVQPMPDAEFRQLVADLCTSKWTLSAETSPPRSESVGVGREYERAIRNMAGLTTRRDTTPDGKRSRRDLLDELVTRCESEDELRTKVLDAMQLPNRDQREIWFEPSRSGSPQTWLADCFKSINNGRHPAFLLPRSIDLIVPDFAAAEVGLDVTIIDTKGVDDLAVREDIDARLRDPRTAIVLCTRFNDAPSQAVRALLLHMRRTFPEQVAARKVSVLALPRLGEATSMKDDAGEFAIDDEDGYDLKREQIARTVTGPEDDLHDIPFHFLNVEVDDATSVRSSILDQVARMRRTQSNRVQDLCTTINDLIENHEVEAVNAAMEEVATQLRAFLDSNSELASKRRDAYRAALGAVNQVRHAATLWASARRNGQYSGLSIGHQTGIGAARDGFLRTDAWFTGVQMRLEEMKANPGLHPARNVISQIEHSVAASKTDFADALQTAGVEVYREPLLQANGLWTACANQWGLGRGFKRRVYNLIDQWFEERVELRDALESVAQVLWDDKVIQPMLRLVDEHVTDASTDT